MQEAFIILPLLDNSGASLDQVHAALELDLLDGFDGFTSETVTGAWRDVTTGRVYREDNIRYTVAADYFSNSRLVSRLENLAAKYARAAGQLAVYVKHATGEVVLCSPKQAAERVDLAPYRDRVAEQFGAKRRA